VSTDVDTAETDAEISEETLQEIEILAGKLAEADDLLAEKNAEIKGTRDRVKGLKEQLLTLMEDNGLKEIEMFDRAPITIKERKTKQKTMKAIKSIFVDDAILAASKKAMLDGEEITPKAIKAATKAGNASGKALWDRLPIDVKSYVDVPSPGSLDEPGE